MTIACEHAAVFRVLGLGLGNFELRIADLFLGKIDYSAEAGPFPVAEEIGGKSVRVLVLTPSP